MKVIGIVGSRRRDTQHDFNCLVLMFQKIYCKGDWILSGGCYKGADKFAEMISEEKCIPMVIYEANWDKYGKAAGPIRNKDIAKDCDVLIALPALDRTGGTESTIKYAIQYGKEIHYV